MTMEEIAMKIGRTACVGLLLAVLPALSGCWYAAAAGTGAYGSPPP